MSKRRLMIVEDDHDIQEILGSILVGEGYEIHSAKDGEDALRRLEGIDPHLILLDMNMPKMGGVSFYHKIYDAAQEKPRYPVLFLTGRAEMEKLFRDLHADGFLSKPFQLMDLLREVKRILNDRFGEDVSDQPPVKIAESASKVLIVDGVTKASEKIALRFLNAGYSVDSAASAELAVEKLKSGERFSLILVRLKLPDMPGDMLAYRLKHMPGQGSLPVLIYAPKLSPVDRQLTQEICQRAGIPDPIESDEPDVLLRESAACLPGRDSAQ